MKDTAARRLSKRLGIKYTAALRLVRQARAISDAEGISYSTAEKRVLTSSTGHTKPDRITLEDALLGAIESWCAAAYGTAIDNGRAGSSTGLPFHEVDWPAQDIETITLGGVYLDPRTLSWTVDEVFEGGTQAINVEVEAEIEAEGYMHRGDADDSDDITVTDWDLNDHYVEVSIPIGPVTLTFQVILDPTEPSVESLEFGGATTAGQLA